MFDNEAEATITTTTMEEAEAYNNGGAIAAIKTSLEVISGTTILFNQCDTLTNTAAEAGLGGFAYLAN